MSKFRSVFEKVLFILSRFVHCLSHVFCKCEEEELDA